MCITALSRAWHADTEHPRYLERLASAGPAQSVMEVRITDADGNPLPAGETGEIEAKGAAVMLGYWNNPKANAETLKHAGRRRADVREVSAIGMPDADWGEIVVACVVLEDGAAANDQTLDAHCLTSIARFKRPKRYVYLDALPKNNYGKVLKTELRKMMGK